MLDAILFERAGVPSAAIVTDAFVSTGAAIAASWGMPGYAFSVTRHPIVIQTPGELEGWASQMLQQVIAVLEGAAEASLEA